MAYYLQRMGFGDAPFECYAHAEAAFENAPAVAAKCAKWIIWEQDAPVIERLLALHDRQLSEAPGGESRTTATPIPGWHGHIAVHSRDIGITDGFLP